MDELVERAHARRSRRIRARWSSLTSDRMYAIATRILRDGDLAEDALQGAFITAWRSLPTLRDPDPVRGLGAATARPCLLRRGQASPVMGRQRPRLAGRRAGGPDGLLSVIDRDALDRAFRRLSIEQRAVFVLHHHVGLALTEIAETLGIPAGTARSRLHYATRVLRSAIEADARAGRPRRTDGMSATRDPDRILRAWLDLMPDEAPDHAIAAVLQAVETTPQPRQRLPGMWRSSPMSRLGLVAGAAVVVALATLVLLPRSPSAVGPPSPTPSAPTVSDAPSLSAGGSAPASLIYRWAGASRAVAGLGSSPQTTWDISATSATLTGESYGPRAIVTTLGVTGSEIELTAATAGCPASDAGRYAWTLSPLGSQLHVTAISDSCAARQAAFTGDWYRIACKAANSCFGAVDPGTYPTVNWGPQLDPDQSPQSVFGAATYTLPAGWSVAGDHTTDLRFVPSAAYAQEGPDGPPDGKMNGVEAWVHPAAAKQSDACDGAPAAGIARTATGLTDWLAALPSLKTSSPADVSIGGHPGKTIDVQLAPTWKRFACGSSEPAVPLFVEGVGAAGPIGRDPWGVGISGKGRLRVTALDLGGNRTVLLIIRADDGTSFDATVRAATSIIQSFRFA